MDINQPIGVFDSGLGGISVLREITALLPAEDYIFYGDSANAPYGVRPTEEIRQLTTVVFDKLIARGVKAIVIACNTASSAAGEALRKQYPEIPIIAIEPALKPAVVSFPGGTVAVMATEAPLREKKFHRLMESYQGQARILKLPCPGLPEFVERGELHSEKLRAFLQERFASLGGAKLNGIILGCTHYPFVQPMIQEVAGKDVRIFDGAAGTARQLKRRLKARDWLKPEGSQGKITWLNSSDDPGFIERSRMLYMMK